MSRENLQDWLIGNSGFKAQYNSLVIQSVSEQFSGLIKPECLQQECDWAYLLMCASLLAQSNKGLCQDAALRICQYCIQSKATTEMQKDAAAVVLDVLANRPAIRLAEKRGLIREGFDSRLDFVALQDWTRRQFENSINLSSLKSLEVNKFQRNFWNDALENSWISVSAPTSAGKSFIVGHWLVEFLRENPGANIVYLVPTRALIHQVQQDVENLLKQEAIESFSVITLPLRSSIAESGANIFVFTQERFHILLGERGDQLKFDLLIADEAQKIGDGNRGVLLQQAIESVCQANANCKIVFVSPMTENPSIFLDDKPDGQKGAEILREDVMVNQNLIWVSQVYGQPTKWNVELILDSEPKSVGTINLPARPAPDSKRLSFVSYVLGSAEGGNVIYVNGAADAEKTAKQYYDILDEDEDLKSDKEIVDLIDLIKKTIHSKYFLSKVLEKGVAFHYGNMPLLIRTEIERLFAKNKIKYLICTSTLIEGINMPCQSIFVRGPKKGVGKPMSQNDFWNLAGRAGRWGKEFQGNVVCIDVRQAGVWDEQPVRKGKYLISRSSDEILSKSDDLLDFINNGTPRDDAQKTPELDYVVSYLVSMYLRNGNISQSSLARRHPKDFLESIEVKISEMLFSADLPGDIILRNPGISPLAMKGLLDYFDERTLVRNENIEDLIPMPPESDGAWGSYEKILHRINSYLAKSAFGSSKRVSQLALLIIDWMKGYPLARIISSREKYYKDRGNTVKIDNLIRETMSDVENIARFRAPKYLACYVDILRLHLIRQNRADLLERLMDINVLLEFGVSQITQLSLMGLGLSRSSAISVSEFITNDSLSERDCLQWLISNDWMTEDMPEIVKREIAEIISRRTAANALAAHNSTSV